MNAESFHRTVSRMFDLCQTTLFDKAHEYARNNDRLHNFRKVAHLNDTTPPKALGDLMGKHLVSIYDMLDDPAKYTPAMWDEKVKDAINYLLLLRAMAEEMREVEMADQFPTFHNATKEQYKHYPRPDLGNLMRKGMEAGYIPRENDELRALREKLTAREVIVVEDEAGIHAETAEIVKVEEDDGPTPA